MNVFDVDDAATHDFDRAILTKNIFIAGPHLTLGEGLL